MQGEGRRAQPHPLFVERAEGSKVYDVDGNQYVDFHAAFGAVLLGHNADTIRTALIETMDQHGVVLAAAHPLEVQLAERLRDIIPSAEQTVFPCTGSEATFHAIRVARAATGRSKVLKLEGHYHGWHDYVAWSVHFDPSSGPSHPVPGSMGMLPGSNDAVVVARYNDTESIEHAFATHGHELAAFILEPVFFNGGVVLPEDGFLERCRALCDSAGVVLIFDEIISGFRLGLGGAQALYGVTPDLTTLGKAIANGLPISAVTGRSDLMSLFAPSGDVLFAGTFAGHVLNVGAALACLEALSDSTVHERLESLGQRLENGIQAAIDETGADAHIARLGSVWTLYLTREPVTSYRDIADVAKDKDDRRQDHFRKAMLERGVYIHPHYMLRGYITAAHDEEDIARLVDATAIYFHTQRSG